MKTSKQINWAMPLVLFTSALALANAERGEFRHCREIKQAACKSVSGDSLTKFKDCLKEFRGGAVPGGVTLNDAEKKTLEECQAHRKAWKKEHREEKAEKRLEKKEAVESSPLTPPTPPQTK
jgi:hypothetical protein